MSFDSDMKVDFWQEIEDRLHEESALHYPDNLVRKILELYVDNVLNQAYFDIDDLLLEGFLATMTGYYLDERGKELGLTRSKGNYATGYVKFYLKNSSGTTLKAQSDIVIPEGTKVSDKYMNYNYYTMKEAVIEEGQKSVEVKIQSGGRGSRYNISDESGAINSVHANINANLQVDNVTRIKGGSNGESDSDFRQRIFNEINTRLTVNYLKRKKVIVYSKLKKDHRIRYHMTSNNSYITNKYALIPPNNKIKTFIQNEVITDDFAKVYVRGW